MVHDDDVEEMGMTWESVLRDRGYSEEIIADLARKRALRHAADELYTEG